MTTIKIAFPTEDGQTISRHFGRAPLFKIVTLQNGQEAENELRGNPSTAETHDQEHEHGHEHGERQGHGAKFALVADCQVLIGAGMGQPAFDRLQNMGLDVYLTGEKQIAGALAKFQAGTLSSDLRRIHAHHHRHEDQPNVTFFDETRSN